MFIANKNCSGAGRSRLFDPDQSSTFDQRPNKKQHFGYGTGVDSIPLQYDGEGSSGYIVTDTVGIAGYNVPEQQFLLCDEYPEFMSDVPFDGVMGIGMQGATGLPSGSPWYWALYASGQLDGPEFSLYYPEHEADGAEMTLGGTNPDRYTGSIHKVPLLDGSGNFVVGQPSMAINGKKLAGITNKYAILDSGTAYLAAPDSYTTAIYKAISPKIKKLNHEAWGVSCDIIESLAVDLSFTFGSGSQTFTVTMPKEAFNLGPYQGMPGICQTVFSSVQLDGSFLLGAPLLKQYYTVWDGANNQMGFATLKKN